MNTRNGYCENCGSKIIAGSNYRCRCGISFDNTKPPVTGARINQPTEPKQSATHEAKDGAAVRFFKAYLDFWETANLTLLYPFAKMSI